MQTHFKRQPIGLGLILLLCTLGFTGCNSTSSPDGHATDSSRQSPEPSSTPTSGPTPPFIEPNTLSTLVPAPEHPEKRQNTGEFFQQAQHDGVSCGLASLNALQGYEVVTKASAIALFNDIATKPNASNTELSLAWRRNEQLDSEQVQYLMRVLSPEDEIPMILSTKVNTGVAVLRSILDESTDQYPHLEKFILLNSGYQGSFDGSEETDKENYTSTTCGHYNAFRKNTEGAWVILDSMPKKQEEKSPEQILPLFKEDVDAITTNNGLEYQILFYGAESDWTHLFDQLEAQNVFLSSP